jgi:hypothetical protein
MCRLNDQVRASKIIVVHGLLNQYLRNLIFQELNYMDSLHIQDRAHVHLNTSQIYGQEVLVNNQL